MGGGRAGLSSRATGTDLKDYDRKLPNPALQTPRDAGFRELERVHLLCHLVQSQPPRPPPSGPLVCLLLHAVRGLSMSVCHAEKVGTDPVWAQRRPALSFHFLQHFLSSRVRSKGFRWAPRNCCQLVLAWPRSQMAVSWQPSCRAHVQPWFPLRRLGGSEAARGGSGHGGLSAAACCPRPAPSLPSTRGSTPALPCCPCKCWTRRQTHTNPRLSRAGERISGTFHPSTISGVYLFCLLSTGEAS